MGSGPLGSVSLAEPSKPGGRPSSCAMERSIVVSNRGLLPAAAGVSVDANPPAPAKPSVTAALANTWMAPSEAQTHQTQFEILPHRNSDMLSISCFKPLRLGTICYAALDNRYTALRSRSPRGPAGDSNQGALGGCVQNALQSYAP